MITPEGRRTFIATHTAVAAPPLCPEIRLHLATGVTPLWQASEELLKREGLPPPFWAFAWPGGQVVARHVLDHREMVTGRTVLDFAAGGGLASIAAMQAGAHHVLATEVDAFAVEAMGLNAELNGVKFDAALRDVIDTDEGWDVVFAGDVCYERPLAERIDRWLRRLAARGAAVFMGDPGRTYLPVASLERVAEYTVPTSKDLEDREERQTSLWRVLPTVA